MERMEMVKLLTNGSPFDLSDGKTYSAFQGLRSEIRNWRTESMIWRNIYNMFTSTGWLVKQSVECGRYDVDFRPFLGLNREAFGVVRNMLDLDTNKLTDEDARAILVALTEYDSTEPYVAFLTGVSKWSATKMEDMINYDYEAAIARLDIETVWETLSWLSQHTYCEDVMTEDEKLYAAEMAFQE